MQKKFVTNLAFLLFLNLLIKPFWILGIDRSVQNAVGAEIYGQYYALFNFSFLLNILLDIGITNFNNKNIAQNNHLLNKHLSGIIVLRVLLGVLYFLFSFFNGFIIGYEREQLIMLCLLLFNQFLISFILYLRSNLAGLHLFKTDSLISVLDRFIMIIICGILLWGKAASVPFRIEWFVWAQTSAYLITAFITIFLLIRKAQLKKLKWNPLFFLMILKQSYPFAVLILLMTFYNRIDSVMLERLLPDGDKQAGIYAQAYRLLDASNMIAYLFAGLLLPIFSRMIKSKEYIHDLLRLAYCLLVIPAFIVGIVCFVFRENIMNLLYHEHVKDSSIIFGLLMICFSAISTTYIYGTLLTANGNLKYLNMMALGGMVLNVSLNLLLIPRFNAFGAAVSSLITQFIMAFTQVILTYKIFRFKPDYKFLSALALFLFLAVFISIKSSELNFSWMFNFIIAAAGCFSLAIFLKLIQPKEIYKIARYGD
ncbi:MAG TPA: oligosaccharide flippase family protein [Bacteroidia bacterium]|nr:oligosaccharide flippase family protein [Bacteroidia bacterium]